MGLRERDAEFKGFYRAEAERLRRLALFLTGDRDQAADLAQEALLRTYQSWYRIERDDPGPYARRTLVNLHRNSIRRRIVERRHLRTIREPHEVVDAPIEEAQRIGRALRALSPIRRATVVLRFYEDMTEADIARVLDRPLGTVKSDLHRALKTLRPLLEDVKEPA